MPVVVTGASGFIGNRAVAAFARVSPEVRAYVRRREAADRLRGLGAKVAVGELTDVETLETVMAGAHTVCHLVGSLNPGPRGYEHEIVGLLQPVLQAAARAGVRRVLFLSYPGASPDHSNPYLRAKGQAEEAVASSELEHVVLRCTHVYGPASEWLNALRRRARGWPCIVLGTGRQRLAPLFVDDVAAVLAAADDRGRPTSGTWGLQGPDTVTADQLTDLLAGRRRHKLHVSPRTASRLGRTSRGGYGRPLLDVLAEDSLAEAPDAAAEFGVQRTPLHDGLARS